ncbi:hypothetical protein PoB_006248400 [Plakobranchus ocellatus]|uniref:G-protein coupled receptors family 1 profile domain-containing protein n=1 Tax=Plakobranchus ocellatus TaxID=259542 RepID=A0AAV4CVR3_9GAST|nr:hypothetical protein PoB_006248400 [Plakobranchus ocellatus]
MSSNLIKPSLYVENVDSTSMVSLDFMAAQDVTSSTLQPAGGSQSELLTGPAALTATTVIYTFVCVLSVLGIVGNIVNILVFMSLSPRTQVASPDSFCDVSTDCRAGPQKGQNTDKLSD